MNIEAIVEKLSELQQSFEGKKTDDDKKYKLFADSDKVYERKRLPSIAEQKELDKIRLKRKNLSSEAKAMICAEMGFTDKDVSQELTEIEYLRQALPLVIIDCPKFNIDDVISKTAKEAVNDFLLDT